MDDEMMLGEAGFTMQDRELLITLKIELQHLREDNRDYLARIARLESDRVTSHDFEGVLTDMDTLRREITKRFEEIRQNNSSQHNALSVETERTRARLGELEKIVPVVEGMKKQIWIAVGASGVAFFVLRLIIKV